jgi:hypothetical protein
MNAWRRLTELRLKNNNVIVEKVNLHLKYDNIW